MASAVDSRLAYARLSAVATASRLPTATRGSNNSYTTHGDTTTNEQYRDLIGRSTVDHRAEARLNRYWPKLDRASSQAIETLLVQHPVVRQAHARCNGRHPLVLLTNPLYMPRAIVPDLSFTAALLSACAARHGGAKTACRLRKLIELGERKELPALELTLFHGVRVEQRLEIADGMSIEPCDFVNAAIDPLGRMRSIKSPDYARMFTGALTRSFEWGPAVMPASEFEDVEVRYRCREEADTAVALLSVLTEKTISIVGSRPALTENWITDLQPQEHGYGFQPMPGIDSVHATQAITLPDHDLLRFRSAFESLQNLREADRKVLRLAIRRLSMAVMQIDLLGRRFPVPAKRRFTTFNPHTRIVTREDYAAGQPSSLAWQRRKLAADEAVLDIAIAAEILFALPERGKKRALGERVSRFLGDGPDTCLGLSGQAKRFYELRSAIVHGDAADDQAADSACLLIGQAFSWARAALMTWLESGRKPDWSVVRNDDRGARRE